MYTQEFGGSDFTCVFSSVFNTVAEAAAAAAAAMPENGIIIVHDTLRGAVQHINIDWNALSIDEGQWLVDYSNEVVFVGEAFAPSPKSAKSGFKFAKEDDEDVVIESRAHLFVGE